ncbi:MAG: hypothetical protein GC150_15150 [Rhizobiales bacterium]|nr:hypothetical protein [Hyphomicrobiales bacterium]
MVEKLRFPAVMRPLVYARKSGVLALVGALSVGAGVATAAAAEGPATFFKSAWATAKDCVVHELLPRERWNLYTAPDFYDAHGWYGWEASCTFTNVVEVTKGESWRVSSVCQSGGDDPEPGTDLEFTLIDEFQMRIDVPDEPEASGEIIYECKRLLADN